MNSKHTPGPWSWTGEDYRAGWGWQILVGPRGEGIIVGQDTNGGPSRHLQGHSPVDPSLCITGIVANGKPKVEAVHVFSEANARLIVAAPDMLAALADAEETLAQVCEGQNEDNVCCHHLRSVRSAIAKARGV